MLLDNNNQVDWTHYYTQLTKAKADRIKWSVIAFIIGLVLGVGAVVFTISLWG